MKKAPLVIVIMFNFMTYKKLNGPVLLRLRMNTYNENNVINIKTNEIPTKILSCIMAWQTNEIPTRISSCIMSWHTNEIPTKVLSSIMAWQSKEIPSRIWSCIMTWQTNEIPTRILSCIMAWQTNEIPARILSFMHYGLTNKRNSSKDIIIYALWPDNQIKFQQGSFHLCIMAWHTNEIPTRILSFIMYDGVTNKRNSNKDLIIYHEWWPDKQNSNKDLIIYHTLWPDKQTKFQQRSYHLSCMMAWQTNEIPTRIVSFIMHYGLTNKRNSNKDLIICHAWWRDKQTKFQQGSYHLSCMMAWETNEIPTRILSFIMHDGVTNKRNSNKDLIIYDAWWPDKQTKFQQGSYHLSCIMTWQTNEIPTKILSFIMHDGLTNKWNSNKDRIIYHALWPDKQTKFQQGSYHLSCMMAWQTNEISTRILSFIMHDGLRNKRNSNKDLIMHYGLTNKQVQWPRCYAPIQRWLISFCWQYFLHV